MAATSPLLFTVRPDGGIRAHVDFRAVRAVRWSPIPAVASLSLEEARRCLTSTVRATRSKPVATSLFSFSSGTPSSKHPRTRYQRVCSSRRVYAEKMEALVGRVKQGHMACFMALSDFATRYRRAEGGSRGVCLSRSVYAEKMEALAGRVKQGYVANFVAMCDFATRYRNADEQERARLASSFVEAMEECMDWHPEVHQMIEYDDSGYKTTSHEDFIKYVYKGGQGSGGHTYV